MNFLIQNLEAITVVGVFTAWIGLIVLCYIKEGEILDEDK